MSERTQLAGRLRAMAEDIYGHPCHVDLLAAAEAIEAGEWREIASAPKDGTTIILARPGRVTCGEWVDESFSNECHHWDPETGAYCGSTIEGCDKPAHWMSWDGGFTAEEPPTHYWPLPAPPEVTR